MRSPSNKLLRARRALCGVLGLLAIETEWRGVGVLAALAAAGEARLVETSDADVAQN